MSQHSQPRTTTSLGRVGRTATSLAALSLLLFVGTACSDDDDDPVAPDAVTMELSHTSVTLVRTAGQPDPTQAITVDLQGTTNTGVTWTSFRPDIATISPAGVITGLKEGQTFFTATSDADPTVNRSVVVNVVATIVTNSPSASWSWLGGPTRTITATVTNNTNTNVTWSSSNPAVATVSGTGVVTPLTTGTTNIVATSVGDATKTGTTAFTVDAAPLADAVALTSGTAVTGLAGAAGSAAYYRIVVPPGATGLTVTTTGGGDLDLFVRAGVRPTASGTTTAGERCFSAGASSAETCTITNPQPRIFYIFLDAYGAYSGVTLTATVTTGS